MIGEFINSIRNMQHSGPNVSLSEMVVDQKTFDQLGFEMMKMQLNTTNRLEAEAIEILGVKIVVRKSD